MDKRKNNGGNSTKAVREDDKRLLTKSESEKANAIFTNAIKKLYKLEEEEAKEKFITEELIGSQRGNLFIAEHLFGKPKETIDNNVTFNNFNLKDVLKFDNPKS